MDKYLNHSFYLKQNIFFTMGYKASTLFNAETGETFWLNPRITRFLNDILVNNQITVKKNIKHIKHIIKILNQLSELDFLTTDNLIIKNETHTNQYPLVDFLWYELTKNCNLKCTHCYLKSLTNSSKHFRPNLDDELKLLQTIAASGISRIQFIGGEPFLENYRLFQLCKKSKDLFQSIEIATNGSIPISDQNIKFLKELNIKLAFSFYSEHEAEHDIITGVPGSFKKTFQTIKRVNDSGIKFRITVVWMSEQAEHIESTVNFVKKKFNVSPKIDIIRLRNKFNSKLFSKKIIEEKLITKDTFRKPFSIDIFNQNKIQHNCFGKKLYISSAGDVFPCVMEDYYNFGNVWQNSWESIISNETLKELSTLTKDKIDGCRLCEFRYFCFDCRPDARSIAKSFKAKPWYCTYYPERGEWNSGCKSET